MVGLRYFGSALLLAMGMPALSLSAHAAGAGACKLALASIVPMELANNGNRLLVKVKANHVPLTLLLDTGAEILTLNESAGRKVNQTTAIGSLIAGTGDSGEGFLNGVGGARIASTIEIDNLVLGRVHGTFSAAVSNGEFLPAGDRADGVIGMSTLGNFDLDIDVADQQLRLFFATGACTHPAVALDEPIYAVPMDQSYRSEVRVVIPVTINGQPFKALLDTGASGTLLFARTAARLGLTVGGADVKTTSISGIGGSATLNIQRLNTLAIGPLTLRNIDVGVDTAESNSEADLLLGLSFMKLVHVWISNSSHTLVMQYPPKPSPVLASSLP
jgi:clan AA aspartic protease (TIGR02281 family)